MCSQVPKKRPEYRGDRSHLDFITKLSSHVTSVQAFEDAIYDELSKAYDITHDIRDQAGYEQYKAQLEAVKGNFEPRTIVEQL